MKNLSDKAIFHRFSIRVSFLLPGIIISIIYTSFGISLPSQTENGSKQIAKDSVSPNDSITETLRIDFTYDNIKNYIFENLKYPSEAKAQEITGNVHIRFTIDTTGNIKDILIVQTVHPLLAQEASRLIRNMPLWKPITYNGKPKQYTYTIPIVFELKE